MFRVRPPPSPDAHDVLVLFVKMTPVYPGGCREVRGVCRLEGREGRTFRGEQQERRPVGTIRTQGRLQGKELPDKQ